VKRWGWGAIAVGVVAILIGMFTMDAPLGFLAQIHESLPAWFVAFGVFALLSGIWLLVSGANEVAQAKGVHSHLARTLEPFGKYVGVVMLGAAIILPFIPGVDRRIVDLAILMLTYIMLGWGLNIVVGLAGLLDLGYVAFYAVGAYSYALLAQALGLGFWSCLPMAGILAALWGIMLGFPVLRLRGDYLAIVTL